MNNKKHSCLPTKKLLQFDTVVRTVMYLFHKYSEYDDKKVNIQMFLLKGVVHLELVASKIC